MDDEVSTYGNKMDDEVSTYENKMDEEAHRKNDDTKNTTPQMIFEQYWNRSLKFRTIEQLDMNKSDLKKLLKRLLDSVSLRYKKISIENYWITVDIYMW